MRKRHLVVLDINVLWLATEGAVRARDGKVVATTELEALHCLRAVWRDPGLGLVLSDHILRGLTTALEGRGHPPELAGMAAAELLVFSRRLGGVYMANPTADIRSPHPGLSNDDWTIHSLALASSASFLVSSDQHFEEAAGDFEVPSGPPGRVLSGDILVYSPQAFLHILRSFRPEYHAARAFEPKLSRPDQGHVLEVLVQDRRRRQARWLSREDNQPDTGIGI